MAVLSTISRFVQLMIMSSATVPAVACSFQDPLPYELCHVKWRHAVDNLLGNKSCNQLINGHACS